jgi:predicted molibdopterin-dependent oxidoreductase YjgC
VVRYLTRARRVADDHGIRLLRRSVIRMAGETRGRVHAMRHGLTAVSGSNAVVSAPDARRVAQRLRALDCLVVADFFLSETAALADVVLPAASWAEETGP